MKGSDKMRLSTRGRYATRASLYLAMHAGEGPISLKVISEDQEISVKYLENIMRMLSAKGFVVSSQGKGGGFTLAKKPSDIRLIDIVRTTEGSLAPVLCVSRPDICDRVKCCSVRDIWGDLGEHIIEYLSSMTLADMVKRQRAKMKAEGKKDTIKYCV